ncbi:retrotransposon protein, putative, ty1-copia subclass [Tanacetum coccineum]
MNVKLQFIKDNQVRDLVNLPPNAKTIGSKWLFKKKTDMDGNVHTYKARLVAKGFTKTYGVDYEETFSPVADIRAIRILIVIVAYYDYEIYQMDVKTVFLNGHLTEEVYMVQPEGFVNPKYPNRVCKLQRSIYGIKQASRQWNKRFDEQIKKFGFTQNCDESCVYVKASGREAAYILGIKIYRDSSRRLIDLCQSAYIEKILKILNMENSKRGSITMQKKLILSKAQGASAPAKVKRMQRVTYALDVRSIMYVVRCIRLDVAFAHNLTCRFQHNPGELHSLLYRNTKDMFLVYDGDMKRELRVTYYTDVGYPTHADDSKAISIADEPGITRGAKHYQTKVHYLREVIELGYIRLVKVHTYDNAGDPFTKALPFNKHSSHTKSIRLLPASSPM